MEFLKMKKAKRIYWRPRSFSRKLSNRYQMLEDSYNKYGALDGDYVEE